MQRRNFLKKTVGLGIVGAVAGTGISTANATEKSLDIVVQSSYSKNSSWQRSFKSAFDKIQQLHPRLNFQLYAVGELTGPFTIFDAVQSGSLDIGIGPSFFWGGKDRAFQYICATPFGLDPQQTEAWLHHGGGRELCQKIYAQYDIHFEPCLVAPGNTGGWFRNPINDVSDYKGLKFRLGGLGGVTIKEIGATPVMVNGPEILPTLLAGGIDGVKWTQPSDDLAKGFHQVLKNYYTGWQEPSVMIDALFNPKLKEQLSAEEMSTITAIFKAEGTTHREFKTLQNASALKQLTTQHGVTFREMPQAVLKELHSAWNRIGTDYANEGGNNAVSVYDSKNKFAELVAPWYFADMQYNWQA